MAKPAKNLTDRKKDLIDAQDYLSESEKEKAKKEVEKAEKIKKEKKEETKKILEAEQEEFVLFKDEDFEKDDKDEKWYRQFEEGLKEETRKNKENDLIGAKDYEMLLEQTRKNKEKDLPGYRPGEKRYAFENVYGTKQGLSDSMALRLGVSQEKLDEISKEADKKFGKDIFSEAVDSGVVNIGANIVGGGDLVLDKIVGWKNNPLSKASEKLQKRALEEQEEVMEAAERTGKGSIAEFSAKTIVAITEALPEVAIALMSGGGSTAATAATKIRKIWNSTAANPNFWYAAETQLYPIYKEALADGATEDEALRTALGGATLSAGLEGNLGFEKYVKTKTPMTWKKGLSNYVKASALEGVEEVIKDSSSEAVEKWVFDPYKPLLKVEEGEEAVLNLEEALDEWSLGSTVGALSNTSRLFDISLDAYNDKRLKNEWDANRIR
ncbi:MAG: hypothetical protein J6C34_00280 [Oscillospiraceae bacterium]|nr:hypothetical protein [Oscillospiraceae bacterium]